MQRLFCLLAVLALALSATSAFAHAPPRSSKKDVRKKVRVEHVDFGKYVINGEIKRPSANWFGTGSRPEFERLLRLKRSFLPALHQTGKEIPRL